MNSHDALTPGTDIDGAVLIVERGRCDHRTALLISRPLIVILRAGASMAPVFDTRYPTLAARASISAILSPPHKPGLRLESPTALLNSKLISGRAANGDDTAKSRPRMVVLASFNFDPPARHFRPPEKHLAVRRPDRSGVGDTWCEQHRLATAMAFDIAPASTTTFPGVRP